MKRMCLNRNHSSRVAFRRGLCTECYTDMKLRVDSGRTTWSAMEAEGKCIPVGYVRKTGGFWSKWVIPRARFEFGRRKPGGTQ